MSQCKTFDVSKMDCRSFAREPVRESVRLDFARDLVPEAVVIGLIRFPYEITNYARVSRVDGAMLFKLVERSDAVFFSKATRSFE